MARLNEAKEPIPLAVHQVGSCCVSRRDAYRTDKLALPLVSQYLLHPNTPSGRYNRAQAQICAGPDTWLDGAAVDVEGCDWSSQYDGSRVHRYDPDGRLMAQYHLPARNPTMPAFGGPDMKTLFIKTARDKNSGPGGGLYALPADVAGVPGLLCDPET